MKLQKSRHSFSSRSRAARRRRMTIVGAGFVSAAAIISAAIFIGSQFLTHQQIQTTPESGSPASEASLPETSPAAPASSQEEESSAPSSQAESSQTGESQAEPVSSEKEEPVSHPQATVDPNGPAYQKKYPDLYVTDRPKMQVLNDSDKVVYLTFDDGPSDLTAPLLDVLKKYDAKATFFDCCQSDYQKSFAPMMKRCVDEGHTVAVHTYTHKMKEVYASVDAYLDDFYKMYTFIEETTGKKPANFFRFPGGSQNGYNQSVNEAIIKEMTRRGFIYYDWDGDSGDASGNNVSGATIYANTMDAIHKGCNVILMHNIFGKETTLEQVGKIISTAQKEGYVFKAMDGTLDPTHGYLMTNKIFIPAALESPYIQLSDWRMQKEKYKK